MEAEKKEALPTQKRFSCPLQAPFWDELQDCNNILIAGCGGGYDFFSGLPLYFALQKWGKKVHLANLTFTNGLGGISGRKVTDHCIEVTADSIRTNRPEYNIEDEFYFPEMFLSRWFRETEKQEVPVYTIERRGVTNTLEVYETLAKELDLDTVILVDGGTDSLMMGDEHGLGTPMEDMTSIASVNLLANENVKKKFLVCLGYGVDAFHGVCHNHVLENIATLSRKGGYLGCFSLSPQQEEAQKFKEAYLATQPSNSIVCSSVVSALDGQFGNYHHPATEGRTGSSELFINPLMCVFWCFNLTSVASEVKYLPLLEGTKTSWEVTQRIEKWRNKNLYSDGKFTGRVPATFPH